MFTGEDVSRAYRVPSQDEFFFTFSFFFQLLDKSSDYELECSFMQDKNTTQNIPERLPVGTKVQATWSEDGEW